MHNQFKKEMIKMARGHGKGSAPLLTPLIGPRYRHRHGRKRNSLFRTLAIGAAGAVVAKTLMDKK